MKFTDHPGVIEVDERLVRPRIRRRTIDAVPAGDKPPLPSMMQKWVDKLTRKQQARANKEVKPPVKRAGPILGPLHKPMEVEIARRQKTAKWRWLIEALDSADSLDVPLTEAENPKAFCCQIRSILMGSSATGMNRWSVKNLRTHIHIERGPLMVYAP